MDAAAPDEWLVVTHVTPGDASALPTQGAAKRTSRRGAAAAATPAPRQKAHAVMGQRAQPAQQHDLRIHLLVIAERGQVLFRLRDMSVWQGLAEPDRNVRQQLGRVVAELGPVEHLWRWHPEKILGGEAHPCTVAEDGVKSERYVIAVAFMRIVETGRFPLKMEVSAIPQCAPWRAVPVARHHAVDSTCVPASLLAAAAGRRCWRRREC